MSDSRIQKRPVHLWIVGIVSLLWNAMGAFDYLMIQTRNEAYMAKFTPEQLAYFYGLPAVAVSLWAIAVWGSLIGSILLLMTRRAAEWLFLVSLVTMVASTFYNYVIADGLQVMGSAFDVAFTAAIFIISLGLYLYTRAISKRGVLR